MRLNGLKEQDLRGKIWFMPTDTIPGISALYGDKVALDKIYKIKERDKSKTVISLCSNVDHIEKVLGRKLTKTEQEVTLSLSGNPTTIIIIEGRSTRLVTNQKVRSFIEKVGPIYSTSCNRSGKNSITSVIDAQQEFGDQIDYYVTEDVKGTNESSTIIKIIR